MLLLQDEGSVQTDAQSSLIGEEDVMYFYSHGKRLPRLSRVTFGNLPSTTPGSEQFLRVAICHGFYGKGHIRPSCTQTLSDLGIIVKNYESIDSSERATVSAGPYKRAYELLQGGS